MSHLTVLKTELRNLNALTAALTRLGYSWKLGGTVKDFFGKTAAVDLVVEIPGQRAVGFARNPQSVLLELVGDWYQSRITQQQFLDSLTCNYAREQVLASLQEQGIDLSEVREVEEEVLPMPHLPTR